MNNRRCPLSFIILLISVLFSATANAAISVASQTKLIADDAFKDSGFGWAVAIDGDTAVVSAFADYDNLGAAYVYERTDAGWQQVSKLTASDGVDGNNGDFLGFSLAVSGDTVVLGAALDDNENGTDAGAVYLYVKPTDGWPAAMTETKKLIAPAGGAGRGFGAALALKGDTLVVGSPGKVDSPTPGEVFVFQGSGTSWSLKATLSVDGLNGSDSYGAALDYDGQTLAVGAFGQDNLKGAVYLYQKPAAGWSEKAADAVLRADDGQANDFFGGSVAVDGNTILVGANGDDDDGSKSGAVYVFERSGGKWNSEPVQKLTASDAKPVGNFGYAVDLAGSSAVIGASHPDDQAADTVYFFTRVGSQWKEQGKLTDPDAKVNSKFGLSVAVDGNGSTMLAGAIGADAGNSQAEKSAGAAYLFQLAAPIDLALVKKDDIDPVVVGEKVTYTLMVTNNGESDATGVVVIDTLPDGISHDSDDGNCTVSNRVVTCELGTVGKNGGTATVAISVRAESAGSVTNRATVSADEIDANSADNTDSEQTTIRESDSGGDNGDDENGGGGGGGSLNLWLLLFLLAGILLSKRRSPPTLESE